MATQGVLRLTIRNAELVRDVGTADDLVMDPYVVVSNRTHSARTTAKVDAGLKPNWGETIELQVSNISDDILLRVMDENVGANCEIGRCGIKLAAMCVNGGLEAWWDIGFGSARAGRIYLHGEWEAAGSDPVSVSAAAAPGLQQTVMQQRLMAESKGQKPKPPAAYNMPAYNYQEPTKMQAPQWSERQFQSAAAVNDRGFMGQTRRA